MQHIRPAFLLFFVMTVVFGGFYPLAVAGLAAFVGPKDSGAMLLLPAGVRAGYFEGRPSAAFVDDNGILVGAASNLGPSHSDLHSAARQRIAAWIERYPDEHEVPLEMILASASGLDPDITERAAILQIQRVARERGLDPIILHDLVTESIHTRQNDMFGERRVNVAVLNGLLDKNFPLRRQ